MTDCVQHRLVVAALLYARTVSVTSMSPACIAAEVI